MSFGLQLDNFLTKTYHMPFVALFNVLYLIYHCIQAQYFSNNADKVGMSERIGKRQILAKRTAL